MSMVTIRLPEEVLTAARIEKAHASEELRKIVALELYRENAVSVGKASEIAGIMYSRVYGIISQDRNTTPLYPGGPKSR